jgi:putative spermidine/putrescine transport system permease protein
VATSTVARPEEALEALVAPAAPRATPRDGGPFLVAPAAMFLLLAFVYPFLYGVLLSFRPQAGNWLANYAKFFSHASLWPTVLTTLWIALPATCFNIAFALPVAYVLRRKSSYQRVVTTLLVVPMTLGTVLIAEGLLNYLGPRGWVSQALRLLHLYSGPLHLTHNYWGVVISLVVSGFPFVFLLLLSYLSGIDPQLAHAAATLGANPWQTFRHVYLPLVAPGLVMAFCLAFVQAFSVLPSAVLLGAPAGPTRVISIAAYEAAFEQLDAPLASCIATIMGLVQLLVVALALALRRTLYRGPVTGGKG